MVERGNDSIVYSKWRVVIYGVLIENFCKVNKFDRAIKSLNKSVEKEIILRRQNSLDMEASAYNPMIQYLCHHCQTGKAEILFWQLMKKGVLDPTTFNNLIGGHAKRRESRFKGLVEDGMIQSGNRVMKEHGGEGSERST
ncbi:hypothetical protein DITRI_Ditri17bG0001800 [Diplodiscus trichospermus]